MPLSTLDPVPALVVIDLQKGLIVNPSAHPIDGVLSSAARLAAAFRRLSLPVTLVTMAVGGAPGRAEAITAAATAAAASGRTRPAPGPDFADLADELAAAPDDHLVVKHRWSAFTGTDLDAWLRERGATQVVLAGIATSLGVESTARAAHEHDYHVVLATDAMTDISLAAHENSVARIFPLLGETTVADEIIDRLDARAAAPTSPASA